jgi:membrane fusion protein, multidrug efflux system
MMQKLPVVGAAGFALTVLLTILYAGSDSAGKQDVALTPPAAVTVETAERRDVPALVEPAARIEAAATVEIRANVQGRLNEMSFTEGNMVAKDQMLFRIDPRHYEAAVQSAQAVVEKAEADLEMAREQQRVNAQSALRQAEANLLGSNLSRRAGAESPSPTQAGIAYTVLTGMLCPSTAL